ncbi:hypothetical protein [Spirosoma oryzicola]|uniref:hypothetical protein n=1 Tax=Spirosoma oryzicola TaxID=2898794 RepID=UPI001E5BDB4A|nr:hypothetical protein [Spirosoma oryzicola]UHG90091.1 hypothetical protein LQ777_17785 [Spirosoma oryzicola]
MINFLLMPFYLLAALAAAAILVLGIVFSAMMAPIFEICIKTNPPKFYEYNKQ